MTFKKTSVFKVAEKTRLENYFVPVGYTKWH